MIVWHVGDLSAVFQYCCFCPSGHTEINFYWPKFIIPSLDYVCIYTFCGKPSECVSDRYGSPHPSSTVQLVCHQKISLWPPLVKSPCNTTLMKFVKFVLSWSSGEPAMRSKEMLSSQAVWSSWWSCWKSFQVLNDINNLAPDYITSYCISRSTNQHRSTLRSADKGNLIEPKSVTKFGKWSFAFAGSHLWTNCQ